MPKPTKPKGPTAKKPIVTGDNLREVFANLAKADPNGDWEYPEHLQPLVDMIEGVVSGTSLGKYHTFSCPVQHGKTTLCLIGLLWIAQKRKGIRLGFATYGQSRAQQVELMGENLLNLFGFELVLRRSKDPWELEKHEVITTAEEWTFGNGSYIKWTYLEGPATGTSLDFWLFDDLIKGTKEANSTTYRKSAEEWLASAALTRWRYSDLRSCIAINTRFHHKDIIWWLGKERGAIHVNVPAINDKGEALWPHRHPIKSLLELQKQMGKLFETVYQGVPSSLMTKLFQDPTHYTVLPSGFQYAMGLDCAYTAGTSSDYSVVVLLGRHRNKITLPDGSIEDIDQTYLIDIYRAQQKQEHFGPYVKAHFQDKYKVPIQFVGSGNEGWIAESVLKGQYGLKISYADTGSSDKYSRAVRLAAAWNRGDFLLPDPSLSLGASQTLEDLKAEFDIFNGKDDEHDDCIDAISSAWNHLNPVKKHGWGLLADHLSPI